MIVGRVLFRVAERSEDLAQGPGLGCGVRVEFAQPGPGSNC